MKKLLLLMFIALLSLSLVSAYQLTCYTNGQVMPSGRTCDYSICQLCLTDSGYSTAPNYCFGQTECVYYVPPTDDPTPEDPGTEIPTQTVPPGWDYSDVLERLEYLETKTVQQDNEIDALQSLIETLQNSVNNLLNMISGGGMVGCAYNNPACGEGLTCQNNQCVSAPTQQGCQYNNPACGSGQICVENQCVQNKVVTFRTSIQNGKYQTSGGEIAVDLNGDGNLECFKYESYYSSYSSRFPVVLTKTMENREVHKYTTGKIIVRDFQSNPIYGPSSSCTVPLSKYPVSGYETREVYQ